MGRRFIPSAYFRLAHLHFSPGLPGATGLLFGYDPNCADCQPIRPAIL